MFNCIDTALPSSYIYSFINWNIYSSILKNVVMNLIAFKNCILKGQLLIIK